MFKNIILTGFMGTGKTSVGTRLAKDLDYTFVDTDSLIEADQKTSITTIFSRSGEPYFREVESKIIDEVMRRENQVVCTGGGAVIADLNRGSFQKVRLRNLPCRPRRSHIQPYQTGNPSPAAPGSGPLGEDHGAARGRARSFLCQADITVDTSEKSVDDVIREIKERIKHAYC